MFFHTFAELYFKTSGFYSFYTSPAIGSSFLPLLKFYKSIGFCLLIFLILFSPACLLSPVDSFLLSIYIHNDPFFPLFSFILLPILSSAISHSCFPVLQWYGQALKSFVAFFLSTHILYFFLQMRLLQFFNSHICVSPYLILYCTFKKLLILELFWSIKKLQRQ